MLLSRPKILINGCGITYQGTKTHKTWPHIFKILGLDTIDVSAPAVSNQWILNKTFLALIDNPAINTAVVQLTMIGKLDVEVDRIRAETLVANDSLRNFVIEPNNGVIQILPQGMIDLSAGTIWPSSKSLDHQAKKFWQEFLFSPGLEMEDIFCKLMMMDDYCRHKKINLLVFQGYDLPWQPEQLSGLRHVIKNPTNSLYREYQNSLWYQCHDSTNANSVPCFQYQVHIAEKISRYLDLNEATNKKLSHLVELYAKQE